MDDSLPRKTTAVLIFADSHERDLRRKGLARRFAPLLTRPKLAEVSSIADLHWFTDHPARAGGEITAHRQRGRTFGQRLENAVADLTAAGYQRIVIVGRDCPQLSGLDVHAAIDLLDSHRLVIGPDHRGGCWLIAFHTADRARLAGIRWQHDADAAELSQRFGANDTVLLDVKFDLDHCGDLAQLARCFAPAAQLLANAAPVEHPILLPHRDLAFIRIAHQLPPPIAA